MKEGDRLVVVLLLSLIILSASFVLSATDNTSGGFDDVSDFQDALDRGDITISDPDYTSPWVEEEEPPCLVCTGGAIGFFENAWVNVSIIVGLGIIFLLIVILIIKVVFSKKKHKNRTQSTVTRVRSGPSGQGMHTVPSIAAKGASQQMQGGSNNTQQPQQPSQPSPPQVPQQSQAATSQAPVQLQVQPQQQPSRVSQPQQQAAPAAMPSQQQPQPARAQASQQQPQQSQVPSSQVTSLPQQERPRGVSQAQAGRKDDHTGVQYVKYYAQNLSHDPRVRIKYLLSAGLKFVEAKDMHAAKQIYAYIFEDYHNLHHHDDTLYADIVAFKKKIQ